MLRWSKIVGVATIVAVTMTGCPPSGLKLGEWTFVFDGFPNRVYGVVFKEGGTIETPPGYEYYFTGTVSWMQEGNLFTMHQHEFRGPGLPDLDIDYIGTLRSPRSMQGQAVDEEDNQFGWSASFVK